MDKNDPYEQAVGYLTQLDFTTMESEVYVALLQEAPMTGYRIAARLGKATANIYRVLRSLTDKGAILSEEGDGSLYRAVPVKELLDRRTREFEERRDAAFEILKNLDGASPDTGIYRLHSRVQVMARAREMLARAQEVALMVGFPELISALADELAAAAARGAAVAVKSYAPMKIAGVECIESTQSAYWQRESPGSELRLVVDAEEYLMALMIDDGVLQALWSASPFLGYIEHNNITLEHTSTRLARAIQAGADLDTVRALLVVTHPPVNTPGHRKLKHAEDALRSSASKSSK